MRLTTLPPSCAVVMKSGDLNFLEPSGSLQACNGTALPYYYYYYHHHHRVPEAKMAVACSRRGANNPLRRNILRPCRTKILNCFLKKSETSIRVFIMTVVGLPHIVLCGVVCCYVRICGESRRLLQLDHFPPIVKPSALFTKCMWCSQSHHPTGY